MIVAIFHNLINSFLYYYYTMTFTKNQYFFIFYIIKEQTFKTSALVKKIVCLLVDRFPVLCFFFIIYIITFLCALSVTFVYFFEIFINISKQIRLLFLFFLYNTLVCFVHKCFHLSTPH